VTERVEAIAVRKARLLAEAIVDTVKDPLVVLDGDLKLISANRSFYREFGGAPEATVGKPIFEIGKRQWDFPEMHDLLESVLPRDRSFSSRRLEHDFPAIGRRHIGLSGHRIVDESGSSDLLLLAFEMTPADPP
jgi:two-component system CheB/CheR fusion protein